MTDISIDFEKVFLVGDIHGNFAWINRLGIKNPKNLYIQLGDYGLGFSDKDIKRNIPSNIKFIRGNHCSGDICKLPRFSKNYLGDFGVVSIFGKKIFFLSGALSYDAEYRKMNGLKHFEDEELSYEELGHAIELCLVSKPDIILSHDAPIEIAERLVKNIHTPSRTNQALSTIFSQHQPKEWYFGHHHRPESLVLGNTFFRCVDIEEVIELEK